MSDFWTTIKNSSHKKIIASAVVFLLVPLSYLITYFLRLGEAAYYGIPFSLVTVTISDFFRYLLPVLLVSLVMILMIRLMIKKMPRKVTVSYCVVSLFVVCVYLFFVIFVVSQFGGAKLSNWNILIMVPCLILVVIGNVFPQNKIREDTHFGKIISPLFACIRETSKKFFIGFTIIIGLAFLMTISKNNMPIYYFLILVLAFAVLFSFNSSVSRSVSAKQHGYIRMGSISLLGKIVLSLLVLVLSVLSVAFCFSISSLLMTINQEKIMVKLDNENELVCVLATYENDYAVGIEAYDLGDEAYSAEIPESGDFRYFQLSDKAEFVFAADCEVKNVNSDPIHNAIGI